MILALILSLASPTVRPRIQSGVVEAPRVALAESGPSTGSGRTEEGRGSALDAERAFAADAQRLGQWTAFRKWAASDATMFVPQPINAQSWLKDRKDPAKAIEWWPTASYVSCDGSLAVNTGGWKRPDGAVGYFSTVWQRQKDGGWKWIVDGGDELKVGRPRPTKPKAKFAQCLGHGDATGMKVTAPGSVVGEGHSEDGSLFWAWSVDPDGARLFSVTLHDHSKLVTVLTDKIAASK